MRFEPSIKVAYIVACATLLSGAIGFRGAVRALNAFLHKQPAPLREPLTTLPMTFGKWRSMTKDEQLAPEVIEELGTSSYLNRVYSIDGDPAKGSLHLHIAFYTGMIDSVPHVPERCFTAGGGLEERAPPKQIRVPVDRSRWRDGEGPTNLASGARYPLATVADPVTLRQDEVVLPLGETLLTMIEFEQKNDPELLILGGYFFVANGRITPSAYSI
ncbi:MAG: exosortase-associated EpsI family protein, partial [Phycisphaerae bacterium]|nr:exosortase-associated EpsI family protein [Phycisphaerae bacterium]